MLSRLLRLYHTVKPLRFEQISYRIYYRLRGSIKLSQKIAKVNQRDWSWSSIEVATPSYLTPKKVIFLNKKVDISHPDIWNDNTKEKLWLYNLHYFDDLNAIDSLTRKSMQCELVARWIAENPPVKGNGWEPYPISLRLVNWIKWYNRAGIDDQAIVNSITKQAEALSKQLEYHILGNHLFANAKALVFVGCFLEGELGVKYLKLGLKLLDREIPEQFLDDGGHFELSPMYHCILLWDLLDLINLANISSESILLVRLEAWRNTATKALDWLNVMIHPDGDISFFNDATIGISASPSQLFSYADSLNLRPKKKLTKCEVLKNSGYSRITYDDYNFIFDHGEVGPSYLPGHAHADTLSFEMSVGKSRFFVNSGTSLYGVSDERHRQRGSAAHNTVVVDSSDSSEVWSGFRVARRAHSKINDIKVGGDSIELVASHNGYTRLNPKVIHTRKILANHNEVIVTDSLNQSGTFANAYFHIHPDIKITIVDTQSLELLSADGQRIIITSSVPLQLEKTTYHPAFGISIANQKMCASLKNGEVEVSLKVKRKSL